MIKDDIDVKAYYLGIASQLIASHMRVPARDADGFYFYIEKAVKYLTDGKHEHCRQLLGIAGELIEEGV